MSALAGPLRSRARITDGAVDRARLRVVPRGLRRAPRVPFVALVSLVLVAGVAGLLFFNTSMQQQSFRVTALQQRATVLNAERQGLQMTLDKLRNPQRIAQRARALGMVPPTGPAFLRLSDGKILGDPSPATSAGVFRINPLPTRKPRMLMPPPVIEKASGSGAATQAATGRAGTKNSTDHTAHNGSAR